MPEYPGQLNKFFGKNGFPTEKKHTDIELFQTPPPPAPNGRQDFSTPLHPDFLKQEGQKKCLNRINCCHNYVINPSRKTICSYFVFNYEL